MSGHPRGVEAESVGARIRELRKAGNLSQNDLAGEDLSPSYISLLEAGRRIPSPAAARLLAERLGVSAEYLMTGQEAEDERQLKVELAFLRLAIEQGDHGGALARATALAGRVQGGSPLKDEFDFLSAKAHEGAGQLEEACRLLEPLAVKARDGKTHVTLAPVHMLLASSYLEAGDVARAAEVAEAGITAAQRLGWLTDPEVARLAATAVWAYLERGDALYASLRAEELLKALGEGGHPASRGSLMWNAALAQHARGNHDLALGLLERAAALLGEGHEGRDLPRAALARGWLLLRTPEPDVEAALGLLNSALERLLGLGSSTDIATCETEIARAQLFRGSPEEAQAWSERALRRLGPKHRLEAADASAVQAEALLAQGETEAARESLEQARRHLLLVPSSRDAGLAWARLAEALHRQGHYKASSEAALEALATAGLRTRWDAWAAARQPVRPPTGRFGASRSIETAH